MKKGYEIKMKNHTLTLLDTKRVMIANIAMTKNNRMFFLNIEIDVPNEGKIVINRDIEINKKEAWDWKINDNEKYDFLFVLDKEEKIYEDHQEPIVTPPQTPMSSTSSSPLSFSSSESSSSDTLLSLPWKMRSLSDLYEATNPIDDYVTLYYHLATCYHIVFEEVADEKWRINMDK